MERGKLLKKTDRKKINIGRLDNINSNRYSPGQVFVVSFQMAVPIFNSPHGGQVTSAFWARRLLAREHLVAAFKPALAGTVIHPQPGSQTTARVAPASDQTT